MRVSIGLLFGLTTLGSSSVIRQKRDQASINAALAGARAINASVAYQVCLIGNQSKVAAALVQGGNTGNIPACPNPQALVIPTTPAVVVVPVAPIVPVVPIVVPVIPVVAPVVPAVIPIKSSSSASPTTSSSTVIASTSSSSTIVPVVIPTPAITLCSVGSYSTSGSSPCSPCPVGQISFVAGSTSCQACTAGTFTENGINCNPCSPGYSSLRGAVGCSICPAGSRSRGVGDLCTLCSSGTFAGSAATTACTSCPLGSFASGVGSTYCNTCDPGTFAASLGATSCISCNLASGTSTCNPQTDGDLTCALGYALNVHGSNSSVCSPCGPGSTSPLGGTICSICPAGQTSKGGDNTCSSCPAGTTSLAGGLCTPCLGGTYSAGGAASCTPCDVRSWSLPGAAFCTACSSGISGSQISDRCVATTGVPTQCSANYGISSLDIGGVCVKCSNIQVSPAGSNSCITCQPLTFVSAVDATCKACNVGTSICSQATGNAINCLPGYAQDGRQLDLGCYPCSRGYASIGGDQLVPANECLVCLDGAFSDGVINSVCTLCTAGTWAQRNPFNGAGATMCDTCVYSANGIGCNQKTGVTNSCAAGYTPSSGSCVLCQPNFYSLAGDVACTACTAPGLSPVGSKSSAACVSPSAYYIIVTDTNTPGNILGYVAQAYPSTFNAFVLTPNTANAKVIQPPRSFISTSPVTLISTLVSGTASTHTAIGLVAAIASPIFSATRPDTASFTGSEDQEVSSFFSGKNDRDAVLGAESNIWVIGGINADNRYPLSLNFVDSSSTSVTSTYFFTQNNNLGATAETQTQSSGRTTVLFFLLPKLN